MALYPDLLNIDETDQFQISDYALTPIEQRIEDCHTRYKFLVIRIGMESFTVHELIV